VSLFSRLRAVGLGETISSATTDDELDYDAGEGTPPPAGHPPARAGPEQQRRA